MFYLHISDIFFVEMIYLFNLLQVENILFHIRIISINLEINNIYFMRVLKKKCFYLHACLPMYL